ncbi:MAG: permease [Candidatus Gracilibacteria bacterium]|jgi:hypothetical protein
MDIFYPLELFAEDSHLAEAVRFFIADIIKIFLLLVVIIFTVSIIRTFIPPDKARKFLARKNKYVGNVLASLIGIVTPFCTCSAIPLFLGFLEAGVPVGVTFSFLIASPMINEVALVLLLGTFGWKVAFIYIGSGLIISILSGIVIGWLKPEGLIRKMKNAPQLNKSVVRKSWSDRAGYGKRYTLMIIKRVWIYILIGVGLGAWMHGYVPTNFLAAYAGPDKWYAVIFATLIGIPLYSNAAGVIPLVSVLTEKGVSIGTTLAFMMAVTGLSLPEFLILKKVMKVKLILIFAGVVGTGIIFTGYLFNYIL